MKKFATIATTMGLLFAGACGDSAADNEERIAWFVEQGETQEAAECFAKELSQYSVADLDVFETAESEDDIPEDLMNDAEASQEACADL